MSNSNNQVTFECIISEVKCRTTASNDKVGRLVVEFPGNPEILNGLNNLHKSDETVTVAIVANPEGSYYNG